ncbi:hypothetical protein BZB76_2657 [Actinomadura pelletieri DSM 43383]|uniref:Uncharacterized protein n=1 Tax=Actinomadura pelletieri DSM 43383 TaxID=1120940 RepID=A0A495QUU4_9ACTN|nr:hypothetical protein [Actinomadura pelletieri]RKS77279.1 hypothetical protein BZB76_2657 [Actinomadura pelletieri DSM 43383]
MERTRTVVKRLRIVGGVFLVLGLILGFRPIQQDGQSCGTAFFGNSDESTYDGTLFGDGPDCEGARASARPLAVTSLGLGVGVLVAAWVIAGLGDPGRDGPNTERYFLGRKIGTDDESPEDPHR